MLYGISKTEYKEYRKTHTKKDATEHFSIGRKKADRLDKECEVDTSRSKAISLMHLNLTDEQRELRNKHNSESVKKKWEDVDYRKRCSNSKRGKIPWNKGKKCPQLTGSNNGFYNKQHTSNTLEVLREKALTNWLDEQYVSNVLEGMHTYWSTDDARLKNSESQLKYWESLSEEERVEKIGNMPHRQSSFEKRFASLLENNNIEYETEFVLKGFRYDFKVGDTLIEINPTVFHNIDKSPFNTPKEKNYHNKKSLVAKHRGYRCIQVWDWDDYEKIISLLIPMNRIYARKCLVKIVDKEESIKFIDKYHLQKSTKTDRSKNTIRLGLYYNDELVSIMTFGKPRYNKNYEYELIRYCSSYNVIGGAEKLWKHFLDDYSPTSVISYCDFSKFTGKTYEKLGFIEDSCSINYHWYNGERHITNNLLRQQGADRLFGTDYGKGTSNEQIALSLGYVRVCDSGQLKYIYNSGSNK